MPHYLRAIGLAGLAWWVSYLFFIERGYHSKHDWDRGALACISILPALFTFLAAL